MFRLSCPALSFHIYTDIYSTFAQGLNFKRDRLHDTGCYAWVVVRNRSTDSQEQPMGVMYRQR